MPDPATGEVNAMTVPADELEAIESMMVSLAGTDPV